MGDKFWLGVSGTVIGGVLVLFIGARYFGQGANPLVGGNTGGGGPQNAGARPIKAVVVYPAQQSQPSWFIPDPASDLYNSSYGVTPNVAGMGGTQDFFGVPLGRRTDSATIVIAAPNTATVAGIANKN